MKENCIQTVLNVGALNTNRLPINSILQNNEIIYVWDSLLIRLLSKYFQIPYNIIIPPDGEWGKKLPDGNWTGLIGMVSRSEVDFAVGGLSLTYDRFQVVNFSYPYLYSDMTFITDKLKPLPNEFALFYPFPWKLWILIAAIIFSVSFLFYIFALRKKTFQSISFMVFGSLLGQATHFKMQKGNQRVFLITWLAFIFFITNIYKGNLLSFLSFPPLHGIRNTQDLARAAEQKTVACFSDKGNSLYEILAESDFHSWKSIGRCLQQNAINSEDPKSLFLNLSSNKVFLDGKIFMMQYENEFTFSEDSFFTAFLGMPISKHFCLQKRLSKVTRRLFEAGLFFKYLKDEQFLSKLMKATSVEADSHSTSALDFADLTGVFFVLISGYVLAALFFVAEVVRNQR